MAIVRTCKATNPYVRADKRYLNDERLSWKAKGLLSYLLTKPDNWKLIIADLIKKARDEKDSVCSGIKELQNLKYLIKIRHRSPTGKFEKWEDVIFEQPLEGPALAEFEPDAEKPDAEKPDAENPPLITNKELTNETNNKSLTKEHESESENHYQNEEAEETPSPSLTSTKSNLLPEKPTNLSEHSSAPPNQENLNRFISSAAKCEARFRGTYPWRRCDRQQWQEFCEWKGKKFDGALKSGMTPFEAGRGYVLNCEKTELDLEKLFFDWEDFQAYLTRRAEVKTHIPGPRSIQEPPPDRSWLRERIEQAKKEGKPYASTHA